MNTGVYGIKTGEYSFMHDEYWCILVYKGVYTRILVKKRVFKGYHGENVYFRGLQVCVQLYAG